MSAITVDSLNAGARKPVAGADAPTPSSLVQQQNSISKDAVQPKQTPVSTAITADSLNSGLKKPTSTITADSLNGIKSPEVEGDDIIENERLKEIGLELLATVPILAASSFAGPLWWVPASIGGFTASVGIQKSVGDSKVSYGDAIVSGLATAFPLGKTAQSIRATTKLTPSLVGKVVKEEGLRGTAFGAAHITATAAVDEKRIPTGDELIKYSGMGLLTGLSMGFVTPKITKSISKFLGKTGKEIDADIASGKIKAKDIKKVLPVGVKDNDIIKMVDDTITASDQRIAAKTILQAHTKDNASYLERARAFLKPASVTGRAAKEAGVKAEGNIAAVSDIATKIDEYLAKVTKTSPGINAAVNKFLEGEPLPRILVGTPIEGALFKYREVMERMQFKYARQLVDYNFSTHTKEEANELSQIMLKSIKDKNYVRTDYKLFRDRDFVVNVSHKKDAIEEIAGAIIKSNVSEGKAIPYLAARKEAKEQVDSLIEKSARNIHNKPNKAVGSFVDGNLKFKRDIGPAEQRFLGAIKDPASRASYTLNATAKSVYRNEGDAEVAKSLVRAGLAIKNVPENSKSNWAKLELKGNLETNLYVPTQVNKALQNSYLQRMDEVGGDIIYKVYDDVWSTLNSLTKAVKVILNPASWGINYIGTHTMASINGVFLHGSNKSWNKYKKGFALSWKDGAFKKNAETTKEILDAYEELVKFNILTKNTAAADIEYGLSRGGFGGAVSKATAPVGRKYSAFDVAARYVMFDSFKGKVSRIYPHLQGDDLSRAAARWTNDVFPNYDKTSPIIKTASRIGLIKQFFTFTSELARTTHNSAVYNTKMISGKFGADLGLSAKQANVEAMKEIGGKQMAYLFTTIGGMAAARRAWNTQNGVDPETEAAVSLLTDPEYGKFRNNFYTNFKKDKLTNNYTGSYTNSIYLAPHNIMEEAVNAAIEGRSLASMGEFILGEVWGEGTFLGKNIYEGLANVDEDGRKITVEINSIKNVWDRLLHVGVESLIPGFVKEYGNAIDTIFKENPRFSAPTLFARWAGIRAPEFDITRDSGRKVRSRARDIGFATGAYIRARDYGDVEPATLDRIYNDANRIRKEHMDEISKYNDALKFLEYNESQRITILKEGSLGVEDILNVLDGRYADLKKDAVLSISEQLDEIIADTSHDKQVYKEIGNIAKTDALLAKKLALNMKSKTIKRILKVTSKDDLIRQLSPEAKVDYVRRNPDKVKELLKKRIISKDTLYYYLGK